MNLQDHPGIADALVEIIKGEATVFAKEDSPTPVYLFTDETLKEAANVILKAFSVGIDKAATIVKSQIEKNSINENE